MMDPRELEKGTEDYGEVSDLLRALPRVEAPANFEFGVKARIAAGGSGSSLFPFLKVFAPLSLVLLIGGFIVFYGTMPDGSVATDTAGQPAVESERVAESEPRVENAPDQAQGPRVTQAVDGNSMTASTEKPKTKTERRAPVSVRADDIRNIEQGYKQANIICPRGIDCTGNSNASVKGNMNTDSRDAVRELLEIAGMNVNVVRGTWTVRSVSTNSIAERSGVLANDVVESINDQSIGRITRFKGDVKSVTVRREGKSVKLDLRN
jgi:hypothetical protein